MSGAMGPRWAPLVIALGLGGCSSHDDVRSAGKSASAPRATTEVTESTKTESIPVEEDREASAAKTIDATNVKDEVSKLEQEINR